jgi:hypothetical protein
MFQQIEQLLAQFRPCFSRKAAFGWFVTVIAGFMLRGDHLGVTSVIRDLSLSPGCYELLIHFFHSDAWDPDVIRKTWWKLLAERAPVYRVKKRCILIGDGVKQSKEAFHMAGVKKLLQESENSSKPRFIFGHMFGAVGIFIGRKGGKFCAPLQMNIQDGLRAVSSWDGSGISPDSHVVQMVRHSCAVAKVVGTAYLLLDRYFLSVPALKELKAHNDADDTPRVDIITKAKSNCRAYRKPRACRSPKRGRPRLKGASVPVASLFTYKASCFTRASVYMYGEKQEVTYYCTDLLWGQKLYQELRFVLVQYNGSRSILVSTDLSLSPKRIIELYAYRFSIEELFREFKQQIGGFAYHFWSKAVPKLNRFSRKGEADCLEAVLDASERKRILSNIKAIEGFVLFASIAMGMLQLIALDGRSSRSSKKIRYLRTVSRKCPSEATVMYYVRKNIYSLLLQHPDSFITRFIRERQVDNGGSSRKRTA